jgi:hypothetical protein
VLTVVNPEESVSAAGSEAAVSGGSLIDEIVRDGARRMLAAALEAEVAAYIAAHIDRLDEDGRRLVVRNGHARPRQVLTNAGAVEVVAPRVNDKRDLRYGPARTKVTKGPGSKPPASRWRSNSSRPLRPAGGR